MKYEVFTNSNTNAIIEQFKNTISSTEKSQLIVDTLDICHLLGEIERLNKENELLKSNPNFVYAMRNNKAIEYIEKHIVATETENILLDILKGVYKE